MAFEDLHPKSKEYIEALTTNITAGTHTNQISRYSGDVDDPRARIVQTPVGSAQPFTIFMEGYAAGDSFQRLVVKGLLQGGWVSPDTWEGTVTDLAVETAKAG